MAFIDLLTFTQVSAFGDRLTAQYTLASYMMNSFNLEQAISMGDVIGARNRGEVIGALQYMHRLNNLGYSNEPITKIELTEVNYRIGTIYIDLNDNSSGYGCSPQYSGSTASTAAAYVNGTHSSSYRGYDFSTGREIHSMDSWRNIFKKK